MTLPPPDLPPPPDNPPYTQPPPPGRGSRLPLILGIVIVVLLVCCGAMVVTTLLVGGRLPDQNRDGLPGRGDRILHLYITRPGPPQPAQSAPPADRGVTFDRKGGGRRCP